jgi:hypothetical protein
MGWSIIKNLFKSPLMQHYPTGLGLVCRGLAHPQNKHPSVNVRKYPIFKFSTIYPLSTQGEWRRKEEKEGKLL